ncbi:DUF1775 domain-containing protein [Micromonospora halotolerans]|uniref:DUF1775 domain-containing protein n=1 Tax=Micromonospora halotolerans TaxID=709879 RepID=A0ABY9ZYD6_9ACTN|nr:DUF1775 domain-containing protein [Micromonospora halotolerans]WNM39927.1 DUF1775 domain-containing protein [Micromonospora halotolerans]
MTMIRRGRWWAAALLAATVGETLGWPGAASAAEVTLTTSPAQVHQGDAIELAVVLPEERAGSRTSRIELRMPVDAPIGEVYPLSVPDWAPTITTRTLDQPVAGIHSSELNQVTDAVSWIRVPGTTKPARLSLGMGPMPATDKLTFTVIQTYTDGTVVRWADPPGGAHPAPTVTLLPPVAGAAAHAGHGEPVAEAPVEAAAPVRAEDDGPSADLLLGGGLLAGLAGGAAIGWLLSRRRRDTLALPPDSATPTDGTLAPAAGDDPAEPRPTSTGPAPLTPTASR